eukprot:gene24219-29288_t
MEKRPPAADPAYNFVSLGSSRRNESMRMPPKLDKVASGYQTSNLQDEGCSGSVSLPNPPSQLSDHTPPIYGRFITANKYIASEAPQGIKFEHLPVVDNGHFKLSIEVTRLSANLLQENLHHSPWQPWHLQVHATVRYPGGSDVQIPKDSISGCRERLPGIKVVIRRKGRSTRVFVVEEQLEISVSNATKDLLDHFDPEQTLYLFEPDVTTDIHPALASVLRGRSSVNSIASGVVVQSVCDADSSRAAILYMPLYSSRPELKAIGKDMSLQQPGFPEVLNGLYLEDAISKRFNDFGGVICSVLPASEEEVMANLDRRDSALSDLTSHGNVKQFLATITISDEDVSHQLVLLDCRRNHGGTSHFYRASPYFLQYRALIDLLLMYSADTSRGQLTVPLEDFHLPRFERTNRDADLKAADLELGGHEEKRRHWQKHLEVYFGFPEKRESTVSKKTLTLSALLALEERFGMAGS